MLGLGLLLATGEAVECEVPKGCRVSPVGAYDNFRFTEEHQYGYGVALWRHGETLMGLFSASAGLVGDTPTGLLEDVEYEPKTGRISFGARLSTGPHGGRRHRDVPSRDLYRFAGALEKNTLKGELTYLDILHPGAPFRSESVILARSKEPPPTFETRSAWQEHVDLILNLRGPKW